MRSELTYYLQMHTLVLTLLIRLWSVVVLNSYSALDMSYQYAYEKQVEMRRNPYQYVYNIYERNTATEVKFVWNDTAFRPLTYHLKQNMMWNHRSICTNSTFVLLMYFTCHHELERRNLIRQYVKQGMVIDGMTINYVMIVASSNNDTNTLNELKRENNEFNDLLVSMHEDNYRHWPITVLDAYMWARDNCREASYVVKIDGDTWVHYGNLVHCLLDAPREKFYGGHLYSEYFRGGQKYKRIQFHPSDFQGKWIDFNWGSCTAISRDVIPFVNIGTQFMDYIWPGCEDSLISEILRKGGIYPFGKMKNYHWMLFHNRVNSTSIPNNTVSVHTGNKKQLLMDLYKEHSTIITPLTA